MRCPSCKGYKSMIMPDGRDLECDMCHGKGEVRGYDE